MKIALFSSSNSAHFNGWFPCGLSLDRYRNPSRIRQFDVRGSQWRTKEKDRNSQCSTPKSNTRNPPFFPSPTQYQLFPGFLWFFQAGDDGEPNIPWSWRTQNQVHRVANIDLGLFYSSQAVASLAGSQRWRGGRARSFRSSQIILDPLLDKIETIFWRRTLITDDMKGDRADAHHTHRTTLTLIGGATVENHPVVAPMATRHFLRSDRSSPAPLLSDLRNSSVCKVEDVSLGLDLVPNSNQHSVPRDSTETPAHCRSSTLFRQTLECRTPEIDRPSYL